MENTVYWEFVMQQYAKADLDYAYTILLNERNSLALHVRAESRSLWKF